MKSKNDFVQISGQTIIRAAVGFIVIAETTFAGVKPKDRTLERLAYSVHEAAEALGVHYFAVYWLIQRKKIHVCRELPGQILIPRSELLRLLASKTGE